MFSEGDVKSYLTDCDEDRLDLSSPESSKASVDEDLRVLRRIRIEVFRPELSLEQQAKLVMEALQGDFDARSNDI